MWIKKTDQEVINELRARRLGAGLVVLSVALLLYFFGLRHAGFKAPVMVRLAAILMAGIMLLSWHRRAHWRQHHSAVWVCEQCNVIRSTKKQPNCTCGGTLTPLSDMKWLEFPPLQQAPISDPQTENTLRPVHAI